MSLKQLLNWIKQFKILKVMESHQLLVFDMTTTTITNKELSKIETFLSDLKLWWM